MATIVTRAGKGSPLTHNEVDANFTNLNTDKLEIGAALNAAVAATPAVTANTAKVTNATHTGDVTGATALTIANDVVTNAKLANMAANSLKGNNTGGAADPADLTVAQVKTLLAYTAADVGSETTAQLNTRDTNNRARANHTGTQTASTISDFAEAVDDRVSALVVAGTNMTITYNDGAGTLTFDAAGGGGGVSDGDKGDITVTGSGATWTIDNDTVTLAKLANFTTDVLLGRDTAGTGDPELIGVGGGVEFNGAGSIRTSAFTGDVTKAAGGTALTIANDVVTNAKAANMATATVKGRVTAGTGDPEDLTPAQARSVIEVPKITVGTAAPGSPAVGDVWIDTN